MADKALILEYLAFSASTMQSDVFLCPTQRLRLCIQKQTHDIPQRHHLEVSFVGVTAVHWRETRERIHLAGGAKERSRDRIEWCLVQDSGNVMPTFLLNYIKLPLSGGNPKAQHYIAEINTSGAAQAKLIMSMLLIAWVGLYVARPVSSQCCAHIEVPKSPI